MCPYVSIESDVNVRQKSTAIIFDINLIITFYFPIKKSSKTIRTYGIFHSLNFVKENIKLVEKFLLNSIEI